MIDDCGICCEIACGWMSLHLTNDMWTLAQLMAWCHQATSHYLNLNQCWPRCMSPNGITRLEGINCASIENILTIPVHIRTNVSNWSLWGQGKVMIYHGKLWDIITNPYPIYMVWRVHILYMGGSYMVQRLTATIYRQVSYIRHTWEGN